MHSGYYVVFEGIDGAGKSSTMQEVQNRITTLTKKEIIATRHPGATPLGAHLRNLLKYPENIDPNIVMDALSRQMLYMVDTVCFVKTLLEPSLDAGKIVFADRSSFISAFAYGLASGLNVLNINQLFQLITPPPIDRLYVLKCPWDVAQRRLHTNPRADKADHFDKLGGEFQEQLQHIYDNLLTGPPEWSVIVRHCVPLENIIYIDGLQSNEKVVDDIVKDLMRQEAIRC